MVVVPGGLLVLLASVVFSAMFGAHGPLDQMPGLDPQKQMTAGDVFAALAGMGSADDRIVLWDLRMPRILLAALAGVALALSGATMQSVFRNPLAEPFILGISSGAALGASLHIVLGVGSSARWLALPVLAFSGGLLATFATYGIAHAGSKPRTETLLLAGVAMNSLLSACLLGMMFFAGEQFRSLFFWILGGFDGASWSGIAVLFAASLAGGFYIEQRAKQMNLLMLGDDQAAALGVEVAREKRNLLIVASLLASVSVGFAGAIGFVGLIAPHILRLLLGANNRLLVPTAALFGASFLVWADLGARSVLETGELPVGIITALCGAPFFLYLLARRRGSIARF
jgi:iron complex transport system permease protein